MRNCRVLLLLSLALSGCHNTPIPHPSALTDDIQFVQITAVTDRGRDYIGIHPEKTYSLNPDQVRTMIDLLKNCKGLDDNQRTADIYIVYDKPGLNGGGLIRVDIDRVTTDYSPGFAKWLKNGNWKEAVKP